jgi:ribonuclease HII
MIGVDEVGRGCLAGPLLVVAAEVLSELPSGLDDSKKLSKAKREELYGVLISTCRFGEGWVDAKDINRLGLTGATRLGVRRALASLQAAADAQILIDGHINYCPRKFNQVQTIVGGDSLIPLISAASIYAKVTRDRYMEKISRKYSGYGFERHVGYGTKAHLAALKLLGPIANFHRINYAPLKEFAA